MEEIFEFTQEVSPRYTLSVRHQYATNNNNNQQIVLLSTWKGFWTIVCRHHHQTVTASSPVSALGSIRVNPLKPPVNGISGASNPKICARNLPPQPTLPSPCCLRHSAHGFGEAFLPTLLPPPPNYFHDGDILVIVSTLFPGSGRGWRDAIGHLRRGMLINFWNPRSGGEKPHEWAPRKYAYDVTSVGDSRECWLLAKSWRLMIMKTSYQNCPWICHFVQQPPDS